MKVTYLKDKDLYVDSAGRQVAVGDYGKDFYKCLHSFKDTNERGKTPGPNGKLVQAALYRCDSCGVFTVIELRRW